MACSRSWRYSFSRHRILLLNSFVFEVKTICIQPEITVYRKESAVTEVRIVADYGDLCGECPLWSPETKDLFWVDCLGLRFYRLDWERGVHSLLKQGFEIKGFAFNRGGGFVITNSAGIWLWDGSQNPRLLISEVEGNKCQMNDCIADPRGRLLAGTCFYDPQAKYPLGKLVTVESDGKARILDDGFHMANGLGFSPDGRTLYFTDSAVRRIYAYDYNLSEGKVSNRRVFVELSDNAGLPDGLTVDTDGFVWSAEWYGSRVVRYDPSGKFEREIRTPAKQTSSLTFGGYDLTDIFITSAALSGPLSLIPRGYDPSSGSSGGALYHVSFDIRGKAEFKADIRTDLETASNVK